MGSIKSRVSAVYDFYNLCQSEYPHLLSLAGSILERLSAQRREIEVALAAVERQTAAAERAYERIQDKVNWYKTRIQAAEAEMESCRSRISYITSHPDPYTVTDNDGNSHIEYRIDEEAVASARRAEEEAYQTYRRNSEAEDWAHNVSYSIADTLSDLQIKQNAIRTIAAEAAQDEAAVEQCIRAMESEAQHNLRSLSGVLATLDRYLASKAIFMPMGAVYREAVAAGGIDNTGNTATTSGTGTTATTPKLQQTNISKFFTSNPKQFGSHIAEHKKGLSYNVNDADANFQALLDRYPEQAVLAKLEDRMGDATFYGTNGRHFGDAYAGLLWEQGAGEVLVNTKGDLEKTFSGTCGIATLANIARYFGIPATLESVLALAREHNLCKEPIISENRGQRILKNAGGGTSAHEQVQIGRLLGLNAAILPEWQIDKKGHVTHRGGEVMLDAIDTVIRRGGVPKLSVCSTHLSKEKIKAGVSDHAVTVVGVERDSAGKVIAVRILDTGHHGEQNGEVSPPGALAHEARIPRERFCRMCKATDGMNVVAFFKP